MKQSPQIAQVYKFKITPMDKLITVTGFAHFFQVNGTKCTCVVMTSKHYKSRCVAVMVATSWLHRAGCMVDMLSMQPPAFG